MQDPDSSLRKRVWHWTSPTRFCRQSVISSSSYPEAKVVFWVGAIGPKQLAFSPVVELWSGVARGNFPGKVLSLWESDAQRIDCSSILSSFRALPLWFFASLPCWPLLWCLYVCRFTRTPLCGWPSSRFQLHLCPILLENLQCPYCLFSVRPTDPQRNITPPVGTKNNCLPPFFSIIIINKNAPTYF